MKAARTSDLISHLRGLRTIASDRVFAKYLMKRFNSTREQRKQQLLEGFAVAHDHYFSSPIFACLFFWFYLMLANNCIAEGIKKPKV